MPSAILSRAQGAEEAGGVRAGVGREEVGTSQGVPEQATWEKVGGRKKRKSRRRRSSYSS